MKSKGLRNMSIDELMSKDKELVQELFNLKFQLHTGRLENTAKISCLRKDIARVKTILGEMKG
jgi:large subunit ribosomal protein L29